MMSVLPYHQNQSYHKKGKLHIIILRGHKYRTFKQNCCKSSTSIDKIDNALCSHEIYPTNIRLV